MIPRNRKTVQTVNRIEEFRIYYNQTIHPELMRLEQLRLRLVRLLIFSFFLIGGVVFLQFYVNIFLITLVLLIPITLYLIYLFYQIRKFQLTFKPRIMDLILNFISEGLNYEELHYDSKRSISKDRFKKSGIFVTPAQVYEGEDYISGKVGETHFELCELNVRETSPVETGLNYVFKGIFLYAEFPEETEGSLMLWPRQARQFLTRAIRHYTWEGGENVDHEILNPKFRELFMAYAMPDTYVVGIMSDPMQEAIVQYIELTGKEIYLSFMDQEIYAAITEPKDILEPSIFRSNLSFDLVREFFEDIHLAISIVRDFDQMH